MIETIPNTYLVDEQTIEVPFKAMCSVTGHPFTGVVTIATFPSEMCMEYCSVEEFIRTFEDQSMTHEQVCGEVVAAFSEAYRMRQLIVEVRVESAAHPPALCRIVQDFEERTADEWTQAANDTVPEGILEQLEAVGARLDTVLTDAGGIQLALPLPMTHKAGMELMAKGY